MRATRLSVSRLVALICFGLAGCGGDSVGSNVEPGQVIEARVGAQVRMKLQSIGPGEYASPPAGSSSVVQFLDVRLVTPHVPAGVTQEFGFPGSEGRNGCDSVRAYRKRLYGRVRANSLSSELIPDLGCGRGGRGALLVHDRALRMHTGPDQTPVANAKVDFGEQPSEPCAPTADVDEGRAAIYGSVITDAAGTFGADLCSPPASSA
jgi:hypothetical protein